MDDNLRQMLKLAGVNHSEKVNTETFNDNEMSEFNQLMELAGVDKKKSDKQINEHVIGGMERVRHISERYDDYETDEEETPAEEDELHDVDMLADDIERGGDKQMNEYDQDGFDGDGSDYELDTPDAEEDLSGVIGDAEDDVSELIAMIDDIQSMGMSSSDKHYDINRLMDMPADVVKRVHSKVVGESDGEFMEDGYDEDDKTVDYVEDDNEVPSEDVDVDSYFPDGAHHQMASKTGASGAKHGDNGLQKSMRVSEAVDEMHKKMVSDYRNFLKENRK